MAAASGVTDFVSGLVADEAGALEEMLESMRERDILLLSGGVSAGVWDLVPDALRAWGADIVFHKVTQQPGKPLLFARRGDLWIFALPGNPLACHLGFHRYVAPVIRRRMGRSVEPLIRRARLDSPLVCKGKRTYFQLAHLQERDGELVATPIRGSGSADLFSPAANAHAYLRLEPGSEAPAGAIVTCELLEGPPWRT
jgi:molybdopterin molybdotransferase